MSRTFEDKPAVREMTPLLIGLAGPSGCGKTFSALRLATGIQKVTGGDIFGIDTEGRRMLHYAEDFKFRHVPFGPPFKSLDYLDAVRQCAKKGARIIVIDSMSHEHEGVGGYLEFHAEEEQRMAGNKAAKFAAWQKPSKARNDLIQGLLQLPISFVFCFRAKEKLRPEKGENGKSEMRELGWMPIGGQQFIYEMTASCLLPPGCSGVPDWNYEQWSAEQKLWIKKPKQFANLFKPGKQLTEEIGQQFAIWSNGGPIPKANWEETHAAAVDSAMGGSSKPEPAKGPDDSVPCPACKNNPPRCVDEKCNRIMLFRPSGISRQGTPYQAYWQCPAKCKDPRNRSRNSAHKADEWHAIINAGPQDPERAAISGEGNTAA